jgi:translation initiation factor eIF-2B subunit delta
MIDETVEEIRQMQTHSSSVVAIKATRALEELLGREFTSLQAYERALEQNAGVLRRANPSHASLHNATTAVVKAVVGEADSIAEAKELTAAAIDRVVENVRASKRKAAARAAETLADGETILTHDYSSTVLDAVRTAVDTADLTAYVTEARPRYPGRKTARELATLDAVDTHLLTDGACGHFLSDCDRVVVGMDCIVEDTLYNRVGTFPLVATANRVGVPVTVVGSSTKLIDEFRFENEVRPATEVMLEPAQGITVENPAYDATPVELLSEVVTDEGVREV